MIFCETVRKETDTYWKERLALKEYYLKRCYEEWMPKMAMTKQSLIPQEVV